MTGPFRRRTLDELADRVRRPTALEVLSGASAIVEDVRLRGEAAVREHAGRFDGLAPGSSLIADRDAMQQALAALAVGERELLTRVADRIRRFAVGQRNALSPFTTMVPGGRAGHTIAPVLRAGCYAPGGRYPLPSSLLMTAITARVAGVRDVWVASPRPSPIMLAAAAIADVDGFLKVGGAQAIAALAFGAGNLQACDVVVGPGNAWVAAAKRLVSNRVGVETVAGPSELVVLADSTADPRLVAADLLAQAEHDPEAIPILVSVADELVHAVSAELDHQLVTLPTSDVARAALANGGALVMQSLDDAIAACDALAPEHLHLHLRDAPSVIPRLNHYGALFVGAQSAEVLGDYGAGPNHVLPTSGASRFAGGLSVFSFLRIRTWLSIEDACAARELIADATRLGRLEGLEAHARSAELRLSPES